ncbi:MAG: hypothetical protein U5K69_06045 [Balneolaceae bacterium]|nr:hypothetical protein [Balneolaceae bacterium]
MKKEEIKKLKETINNKLDRYANKNVVKAGEFSDLLKKIHNLDYRDRTKLREEYNRINNVAFKKGVKLDEYNPAVYFEKKPSTKKSKPDSTDKDVIEKKVSVLYENVEDRFKFFPRHIFLLLENDEDETYNILLLYNHENEPFFLRKTKKEIKASGSSECNVYQLEDFIDGVESGELRDKNYIVFFTFKVKSSPQTYIDYIFSILEGYFNISQIKIGDTDENLTYINQIDEIKKSLNI